MKSFKEFIEEPGINESSLSRLWQHLQNGNCIAMFSASRDENTKDQNKENTKKIKFRTRQARFGYVPIKGGFVETLDDGSKRSVVEDSIIVFANKDREQELYQFAVSMGVFFKQESILFIDSKGDAYWVITNNDNNPEVSIEHKTKLGKFHYQQIGNYFSQIGKKRFSFETTGDIISEANSYLGLTPTEHFNGDLFLLRLRECIRKNKNYWELKFTAD